MRNIYSTVVETQLTNSKSTRRSLAAERIFEKWARSGQPVGLTCGSSTFPAYLGLQTTVATQLSAPDRDYRIVKHTNNETVRHTTRAGITQSMTPYWDIFCWFNFPVCARYWLGEILLNHKSTEQSKLGGGRFVHLNNTLYCSSDTSPCTKMLKRGMHCSWQPIARYAVCGIATVLGRTTSEAAA